MLWETTTTCNTIDEEQLDPVIYTGVNTFSQQSSGQKNLRSATHHSSNAGVNLSQQVHLKCRASDLFNSSCRTHYQRGSNYLESKHLGKTFSEARTKIICPVQPLRLPNLNHLGQSTLTPTFESTLAFQNVPIKHRHLKTRRSTQPYFTSLAHFSKPNQPCKATMKARSASISNPLWQPGECSNLESLTLSDRNCLKAPTLLITSQSFKKESLQTLNRPRVLELSYSTVSTDL